MTARAARLVAATAALALGAAALATFAPALPEGLAAACAPGLVLRELLAGLTVVVLLLGPALSTDDPERASGGSGGLLAALTAAPAAVALAAAGGIAPVDLLPAASLLLACHFAGAAYLRVDPAGRRGAIYGGAAAALLAGLPVAAYGLAELGGCQGAAAGFRISPLLAIREVAGGWPAAGPAALLLVAILFLLAFPATARAAPGEPPVLVVGAPREGPAARLVADLRALGLAVGEREALPRALPFETGIVVLGRPPRGEAEAAEWREVLGAFLRIGGRVAGPSPAGLLAAGGGPILGLFVEVPGPDPGRAAAALAAPRVALPHPAARPEAGVAPGLFRIPFPVEGSPLPGRSLGFLAVLAAAFAGTTALARRRSLGPLRSLLALGGISAVGTSLLFLPGVLGPPVRLSRLVLEERASPASPFARRVEILRIERLRAGGGDPVVGEEPGVSRAEIRYAADAAPAWEPGGSVRLEAPGRWALLASVSCSDTMQGATAADRATVRVDGDRARVHRADAEPSAAGEGPETTLAEALAELRRSRDPRVSRAGRLLDECLRPPVGGGSYLIAVPAEGPDAVVTHQER